MANSISIRRALQLCARGLGAAAVLGAAGAFGADDDSELLIFPPASADSAVVASPWPAGEADVLEVLPVPEADPQLVVPQEIYEFEESLDGPIVSLSPDGPVSQAATAPAPDGYLIENSLIGYAPVTSRTAWLPGHDDEFGIVSLENLATLNADSRSGVVLGFGFHFLDGPVRTEMPPRLFDFSIGYQRREWIRPNFGWDVVFRVGAFSDFEGSAKEGVRYPSHAVALLRLTPTVTWLLGIDYLDRDDIGLLPVFGAAWAPTEDLRFDLAFPRPRAAVKIMDTASWLFMAGELGGGTWAIEREEALDDNATYRDVRLIFGIETIHAGGSSSALELGYVFNRELKYRSRVGDYSPRDCLMIALVSRY